MEPDCCADSEHGSNKHKHKKVYESRESNGVAVSRIPLDRRQCKPGIWDSFDAKRLGQRIDHASESVQEIER
jgi:hypothetical protein